MSESRIGEGWPGAPAIVLWRLDSGDVHRVDETGDLTAVRPWASISKMVVALAFGVEVDWNLHYFDEEFGPRGATLANLLSHSSGLGLEEGDRVVPLGTKRIYSNVGIDHAVNVAVGDRDPAEWLKDRVFTALGLDSTSLVDRPSAGVVGSTEDLVTLGATWLRPDLVSRATRDLMIQPYLGDLDGIVPGFGRFSPCPWGLGPELRGSKRHWMGDWPASSFGHFGKSGSMLLLNADEQIGLVATSTEPFGGWSLKLWPEWTSAMRRRILDA